MYSIFGYGSMIADRDRMAAYTQALRQCVKPNSVVLDIGTGTGIFALLACQLGARRVYAIEPSDAIQVAKEMAVANGYVKKIEFIQGISQQVNLPELADVIISDLRGVLPLWQHHIPSIIDARQRLLAPSGVLIPQYDTLWAAVVEAPELYNRLVSPWDENDYNFDMTAARQLVTNTWSKGRVKPEQLLVEPKPWATLDYNKLENSNVSAEVTWAGSRTGVGHGLLLWFDTILVEGVGFSNAPGLPDLIYGNAFFPWTKPVPLKAGDTISVTLQANLVGENYVWRWHSCIFNQSQPTQVKAHFQQSSFFEMPLSATQLRKSAASYVPKLNQDGQIDRLILELMNNGKALSDIAHQLLTEFPNHFASWQEALTRVGQLSQKYS